MEEKKKQQKPRREKGTGRVFRRKIKRPDGSHYYSKKYYLEYTVNGQKKTVCLDCERERDANTEAAKLLKPLLHVDTKEKVVVHIAEARKLKAKGKVKLDEAWELFLDNPMRPDSGELTLLAYKSKYNNFLKWLRKNYPEIVCLGEISEEIALEFSEHIWKEKISERTYNGYLQALKLIVNVLSRQAGITDNPFSIIKKKTENKQSRRELSEDEVLKVFEVFDDPSVHLMHKDEMAVMFQIGCWTGARAKDAALMKWENVDFERNSVTFRPHKTARRTKKSVTIPLHPMLREALEKAVEWRENEYILPKIADRYSYNAGGVGKDAVKVFKKAGLETKTKVKGCQRKLKANVYSFHSFRHSFVSFCARAGVPLSHVQEIVGHGNPAMTRHYTHLDNESVGKAIKALPMAVEEEPKITAEDILIKIMHLLDEKKRLSASDKEILEIIREHLPENDEKDPKPNTRKKTAKK